ncbi:P-loop containing nucleoside triphosphate hydrolase protein [Hyaloraphidium curvatum]|nr:P-loop containing nucleoside triphosphate hydrolase protein [Hyaloraphidium curvatum]
MGAKRPPGPGALAGRRKRPKQAPTDIVEELVEADMDRWGWQKVQIPAAANAADEDLGGLFMLEELDGVDVQLRHGDHGTATSLTFRRVGKSKKGSAARETGAGLEADPVAGLDFINIDDFKEDGRSGPGGGKKKNRGLVSEGEQGRADKATAGKKRSRERPPEKDMPTSAAPTDSEDVEAPLAAASEEATSEEVVVPPEWAPFKLSDLVVRGLLDLGFSKPTPIQAKCLPVAMQWKRDVVGTAETGSGKTLAFGLPIIDYLARQEDAGRRQATAALILTPTRELALQVSDHLGRVSRHANARIAVVVGGMSEQKQQRLLHAVPDVVVATPGRLWELVSGSDELLAQLRNVRYLVLDEADRMLEFGHFAELSSILKAIARSPAQDSQDSSVPQRQTFVFSATLAKADFANKNAARSAKTREKGVTMAELLRRIDFGPEKPVRIDLTRERLVASGLKELQIHCLPKNKDAYLYYSLLEFPGRTLVFVASIDSVSRLAGWLKMLRIACFPLHGKLQQRQRLKNLDRFKTSARGVLIATDVAARGLDISGVQHVVHYHVARNAQTYVHRSGRTARAGNEGTSVSLVAPEEVKTFNDMCHTLKKGGMPEFPVDRVRLAALQKRVVLAVFIEKAEHSLQQDASNKSWVEKMAQEMDIELDDSFTLAAAPFPFGSLLVGDIRFSYAGLYRAANGLAPTVVSDVQVPL